MIACPSIGIATRGILSDPAVFPYCGCSIMIASKALIVPSNHIARNIVTKGNVFSMPLTKGILAMVELIRVCRIRRKGGAGMARPLNYVYPYPKMEKIYYIKAKIQLEELIYTDVKFLNNKIKVTSDIISLESEKDQPIVSVNITEK